MKKSDLIILVVDDDAAFRGAMTEALTRIGYKSLAVSKGDEALSAAKIQQYHAAIIDCMMPRQNGVDVAVELRRTRFGSGPIILMSGVFKDRSFAQEAIEKTKAIDFLNKPFDLLSLQRRLEEQFKPLLSATQTPLHVLVSKPFSSVRERAKVIEGLEKTKGFDLPFILSVLIDAGTSGHLNIANESGEIYGITLQEGQIIAVDSSEKEATILMLLVEMGYLSREDLALVRSQRRRGELLQTLIDGQHLSPHVLPLVSKEQVISDLKRLFTSEQFSINFVPDRKKSDPAVGFTLEELTPLLHDVVKNVISAEHINDFYNDWVDHPIQLGTRFKADHPIFTMGLFKDLPELATLLPMQLTIEDLRTQGKFDHTNLFRGLHILAIFRMIVFDDVKKARNVAEYSERMRQMHKELQSKNPFEVFAYFGVGEGARDQDVERVFREFSRANHPDLLPPNASAETKRAVNQVFSIVSEAHLLLGNPERRKKLQQEMQQREAEVQIQAEAQADDAINFLRRGRIKEALAKTTQAFSAHAGRNIKIAHAWALLKSSDSSETAAEVSKILDSIPHEERRNAQYAFVFGLLKKSLRDAAGAAAQFDKAISMDSNFLEARREKSSLAGQTEKVDILNADLGKLVGNFFKKRK